MELEQNIFDLKQIEIKPVEIIKPIENIIIEKEQSINVLDLVDIEKVKVKRKYTKKEKKIIIDIVEKKEEIKPQEINLDEVFENPLFKKYF